MECQDATLSRFEGIGVIVTEVFLKCAQCQDATLSLFEGVKVNFTKVFKVCGMPGCNPITVDCAVDLARTLLSGA